VHHFEQWASAFQFQRICQFFHRRDSIYARDSMMDTDRTGMFNEINHMSIKLVPIPLIRAESWNEPIGNGNRRTFVGKI
jgi:hypothetical protein